MHHKKIPKGRYILQGTATLILYFLNEFRGTRPVKCYVGTHIRQIPKAIRLYGFEHDGENVELICVTNQLEQRKRAGSKIVGYAFGIMVPDSI